MAKSSRTAKKIETAIKEDRWVEGSELYLHNAGSVPLNRPIYQGDVFAGVPLPEFTDTTPPVVELQESLVMVVPHPCQCYHGDGLRPKLTVAPVRLVENYSDFGDDMTGQKDKFPLTDLQIRTASELSALPTEGETTPPVPSQSHVAALGELASVPSNLLTPADRVASLSHKGIGFLIVRILGFQTRETKLSITKAMTYVTKEWEEALVMSAWVDKHRTLDGFTKWIFAARADGLTRNKLLLSDPQSLLDEVAAMRGSFEVPP